MFGTVQCPCCGARIELGVDTTVSDQSFTTDCDVCCRPFQVQVACEPGEILSLHVMGPG